MIAISRLQYKSGFKLETHWSLSNMGGCLAPPDFAAGSRYTVCNHRSDNLQVVRECKVSEEQR